MNAKGRKIVIATLCLLAVALIGASASATGEAEVPARVATEVNPHIGLGVEEVRMPGTVQFGPFTGEIDFGINANSQEVKLQVEASALYKADDPNGHEFAIPVDNDKDPDVVPSHGNATDGDNTLDWTTMNGFTYTPGDNKVQITSGYPVYTNGSGTFLGNQSEIKEFTSSQNNHFSQIVTVTIGWDQVNPELPQGPYSGWVVLRGMMNP